MKQKLLIAGGDLRQIYCARRLSELYDIAVAGFDEKYIPADTDLEIVSLSEKEKYDCVVLPVPALGEGELLNTPCCDEKISAADIAALLKPNAPVFAGKVSGKLRDIFSGFEVCDYMEREELSLLNAIPTAEGAVQIAIEELPVTLSGQKILIVGCGRIGTALVGILKGFGADVTVSVRNAKGAAKARILGAKTCCTKDIVTDCGLVFNTVPDLIFDRETLGKFPRNTLFIDLASKPGGIDFEAAAELGIKAIWALGLPGKTAPITSGEIIADTISGILSEKGGDSHG
ncbi:MAG: dipicolinate synthase subunit A [Ruminococcus sp.]|nr:dipicolinate synthase subunit A [Ruminococcus sp.]